MPLLLSGANPEADASLGAAHKLDGGQYGVVAELLLHDGNAERFGVALRVDECVEVTTRE